MPLHRPILFYTSNNKPGKVDATGAFIPEARRIQQIYGIPEVDMIALNTATTSKAGRRQIVINEIQKRWGYGFDGVFVLGHGGRRWSDLGFTNDNIQEFAYALKDGFDPDTVVVLYSCLNADGPGPDVVDPNERVKGSLAEYLHLYMCQAGMPYSRVLGHATLGHATENPHVIVMGPCGEGASWYGPAPGESGWSEWAAKMKQKGDYDLRIPSYLEDPEFLEIAETGAIGVGSTLAIVGVAAGLAYLFIRGRRRG
jgi:hypothetical protein